MPNHHARVAPFFSPPEVFKRRIHSRHFPNFQLFTFLMHNCIWGTLKLLWLLWADAPLPHIQIGRWACWCLGLVVPKRATRVRFYTPRTTSPMTVGVTSRKWVLSCSVARTEEGRAFVVCGGWASGNGWRNTNHRPSSAKHTPLSLSRPLNERNKRFGRITVQELPRRFTVTLKNVWMSTALHNNVMWHLFRINTFKYILFNQNIEEKQVGLLFKSIIFLSNQMWFLHFSEK